LLASPIDPLLYQDLLLFLSHVPHSTDHQFLHVWVNLIFLAQILSHRTDDRRKCPIPESHSEPRLR
jgi:hypothetical protein